jgi:dTDP-4-dehydrorhamnose reductase
MSADTVLITGATGLLGATLAPVLREQGFVVVGHGHRGPADVQADLTVAAEVDALLERVRPSVVVNLAALTDVDVCQAEPQRAYELNVRSVEHLAAALARQLPRSHLVQLSTDQVYDGSGPHAEAAVCIRNVYALSKIAGEIAAAAFGATVLRTNFYGRSQCARRASFTDWLHGALSQGRPIQVFDDVHFNPLAIDTLATCVAAVVRARPPGVFNLGARGGMSKADFAYAFAAAAGLPTATMTRSSVAAMVQLQAPRPRDMRMDCRRYEDALGAALPQLEDEIQRTGKAYRAHP